MAQKLLFSTSSHTIFCSSKSKKCKTENWNESVTNHGLKSSSLVFVYAGYPWQVIFVLPPYRPLNANLFVSIQDVLPQCCSVPFTKLIELENKLVLCFFITSRHMLIQYMVAILSKWKNRNRNVKILNSASKIKSSHSPSVATSVYLSSCFANGLPDVS